MVPAVSSTKKAPTVTSFSERTCSRRVLFTYTMSRRRTMFGAGGALELRVLHSPQAIGPRVRIDVFVDGVILRGSVTALGDADHR